MIQLFNQSFLHMSPPISILAPRFHPRQRASVLFIPIRTTIHFLRDPKERKEEEEERKQEEEKRGRREKKRRSTQLPILLLLFLFSFTIQYFSAASSSSSVNLRIVRTISSSAFPIANTQHPTSLTIRNIPF